MLLVIAVVNAPPTLSVTDVKTVESEVFNKDPNATIMSPTWVVNVPDVYVVANEYDPKKEDSTKPTRVTIIVSPLHQYR
jgi:hypothetical protein